MGAYSPASIVDEAMSKTIMETIIEPTIRGMAADGMPYKPKQKGFPARHAKDHMTLMCMWNTEYGAELPREEHDGKKGTEKGEKAEKELQFPNHAIGALCPALLGCAEFDAASAGTVVMWLE